MNGMARWLSVGQWVLVAGMFGAGLMVWPSAPATMPIHWSLSGQPNSYAGTLEGLFLLPTVALLVVIGMRRLGFARVASLAPWPFSENKESLLRSGAAKRRVVPRIEPMRERYVEFADAYALAGLAIVALLAAVHAVVLLSASGVPLNVGLVIAPLVGLLLCVLGAVLGQVRRNWFVGIRTPWTLTSERSWAATHRAGRWVFLAMGVAIAVAGIAQTPWAFYTAMVVCLGGVLGLIAYSYVVWRDDPERQHAA
jgi:uncharacterized membrane protein